MVRAYCVVLFANETIEYDDLLVAVKKHTHTPKTNWLRACQSIGPTQITFLVQCCLVRCVPVP